VLLPLIGRHWLNVTDERGRRRIEDEEDVLRYEIRSALERGLRIVPLTFHGAKMPMRDELPEDIARLTRYQAIAIENEHWDEDVQTLVGTLERMRQEISAQRPGAEGAEGIRAEPRRAEAEKTLRDEVADLAPTGGRADQAILPAPPPVQTREPEGERSAWAGWFGSTAPGAPEEEQRKRKRWQLGGYIGAGLVLVLAAVPSEEPDEGAAYEVGAFLGGLGVSLAIAFAIRLAYVKLIRRDGRPIWSPWIVAMAAVIAVAANA
jgi:hypothetical protein